VSIYGVRLSCVIDRGGALEQASAAMLRVAWQGVHGDRRGDRAVLVLGADASRLRADLVRHILGLGQPVVASVSASAARSCPVYRSRQNAHPLSIEPRVLTSSISRW
jgi:hypothetical protein